MSLKVGELTYLITGSTAGLDKSLTASEAKVKGTSKSLTALAKTTKFAVGAVAGIGAAVGLAVGEGAKAATAFQREMTKVQTQAGASAKDVALLSRQVLTLGQTAQQGPEELAEGLFHLKSLGLGNAAAMRALKQASDLAAISGANLEDATNALGGAWRSGIKGAGTFTKSVATLNAIAGAGNMRMQDLVTAMSSGILPAARTFGVSLSSVGSALALMTDEGIPAVDAATRLRMTLSLMGAPSGVAEKALASIGLTGTKLANAMRGPQGLIGAVQLLSDHLHNNGLDATQAAQVISKAFGGGRSSSAIMTMLNNLTVLKQKQDQINASMGKFGPAVKAQQKTASAQFAILKSNLDVLGIKIGDAVLPAITGVVKFINSTGLPALQRFSAKFLGLVPVAGLEKEIGKAESLIRKLFGLGGSQKMPKPKDLPFGKVLAPDKPVDLPFSKLFKITGGSKGATGILAGIDWAKALGGLPAQLVTAVGNALGKIDFSSIGSKMAPAALGFTITFLSSLLDPATWLKVVKEDWKPLLSLLLTAITIPLGGEGGTLFRALADAAEHVPILKAFAPLLRFADKLLGPLAKAWRGLLTKVFGRAADMIDSYFGGAGTWLLDKGESIMLGLGGGLENIWGKDVLPFFGRIGKLLKGALKGAGLWLTSIGGNIISGLLSGIKHAMAGISGWIMNNVVNPIVNWIKHHFGIHSPSTVMAGLGSHLMTGLFKGIMSHDLGGLVDKVFGSLPKALGALVEKGLVKVGSLPGKALKLLGGLGGKLLGLLGFGGGGGSSGANVDLGRRMAASVGWGGAQFDALNKLWTRESGWRTNADNPTSGAYGIPQSLPASKMATAGSDYLTNPATQIKWGLGYIAGRYGSPAGAWAHEMAYGWYDRGGMLQPGYTMVHNASGHPEPVLSNGQWKMLAGAASGGGNASGGLMSAAATKIKDASAKMAAAAKQFASSVASNARSYAGIGGISAGTKGGKAVALTSQSLVNGLGSKLSKIRQFTAALRKLANRGLAGSLIRQIANMDPDSGLTYAKAILDGPAKYIRQLDRDEKLIGKASQRLGRTAAGGVFNTKHKVHTGAGTNNFSVRVFIGDKELTGMVKTEIRQHDRQLNRKIKSGSKL